MKHLQYLPNFWGALLIIGLLLGLEMIIAAAFHDAGIAFTHGDARASVVVVLANGIVFTIMMHLSGLKYADLFHPSTNTVSSTIGLLFFPVLLFIGGALWWLADIAALIASLFPRDETDLRMLDNLMGSGFVTLIAVCLVAPFVEEMLFRGIILRGFLTHYSPSASIILSALLFGFVHLNIYQIPMAFLLGCFLGWLFYLSKSVWPSIIAHAAYNLGAVIIFHFGKNEDYNHILVNIITFTLSGIGVWLIHSMLRSRPLTRDNGSA